MRKIRNCVAGQMNTGISGCPIDFEKVKGAIVLEHGQKLPADLTLEALKTLCHADRPDRVYPIGTFVEYAKNGGEPQTNTTGYGGVRVTGLSAMSETFTLDMFYDSLNANLLKTMNRPYDVYFYDLHYVLYGYNDGTELMAGIPMSTIYPTATPHPTSGADSTLTVTFCEDDAQDYFEHFDYVQLDFNPREANGLVDVELVNVSGSDYKLVEKFGGYDRTAEFGQTIAAAAATVLVNATAATYDDAKQVLKITTSGTDKPALKAPSALYAANIEGIVNE